MQNLYKYLSTGVISYPQDNPYLSTDIEKLSTRGWGALRSSPKPWALTLTLGIKTTEKPERFDAQIKAKINPLL